jgi:hypothetical protein
VKNRVRWRILVDALCSAAEWWDYWLIEGTKKSQKCTYYYFFVLPSSKLKISLQNMQLPRIY